jgi:hypothetical protein
MLFAGDLFAGRVEHLVDQTANVKRFLGRGHVVDRAAGRAFTALHTAEQSQAFKIYTAFVCVLHRYDLLLQKFTV